MEPQIIQTKIFNIRGQMVMLDFDLAALYETETKYLKRSVKRNITRFPSDFMFELEKEELENLRCNFGTSSWGGTRYPPFAFTEQGVAMLSSVLKSEKAIQVNVAIIRAFVALRRYALTFDELAAKSFPTTRNWLILMKCCAGWVKKTRPGPTKFQRFNAKTNHLQIGQTVPA